MSEKEEVLQLLKDPRVLALAKAVYENIGQPCRQCGKGNEDLLRALTPFEKVLYEKCKACDGEGEIKRDFDELAAQPS